MPSSISAPISGPVKLCTSARAGSADSPRSNYRLSINGNGPDHLHQLVPGRRRAVEGRLADVALVVPVVVLVEGLDRRGCAHTLSPLLFLMETPTSTWEGGASNWHPCPRRRVHRVGGLAHEHHALPAADAAEVDPFLTTLAVARRDEWPEIVAVEAVPAKLILVVVVVVVHCATVRRRRRRGGGRCCAGGGVLLHRRSEVLA